VQEDVLELPHVQPTAEVVVKDATVREVVLAGGGVRRAVPHWINFLGFLSAASESIH
jgi:hypothetical protein